MTGMDLSRMANPMIETLRLPFLILLPIFLMVIFSLFTRPVDKQVLMRFYARMKTPVNPDPELDRLEVERSYAEPHRFDHTKMFPSSQFEFTKWDKQDTLGFIFGILGTILVIACALIVARIGAQ